MAEIKSPCISVCRLKNGICIGCFRTSKEITDWYDATAERKIQIVNESQKRKTDFLNS